MSDLIYLAVVIGFFAVAFALLRACEHIIGSDGPAATAPTAASKADQTPAPTLEVPA